MNPSEITISENPEVVPVREFRNRISLLERLVNVDRHACKGAHEVERWRLTVQRIGSELIATACKRATAQDWQRRERIIDRSARMLNG